MARFPSPDLSIVELATGRLRGEDSEAWELLGSAWATLERFVRVRLTGAGMPKQFLEDCGQNVFTRVWQFRKTYRGQTEGEFWRWVRQICDNERRRIMSREAKRTSQPLVPEDWAESGPGALTSPDDTAQTVLLDEEISALRDCLRHLDRTHRHVIRLAYFAPALTERAIAELLDCSPANVHKLKAAGLKLLQACLSRKGIQ